MPKRAGKLVEILSPGKNLFYSKEAIKCGADAIYIGAPKFSLRHEHGNTMQDIKDLIDFAHKYWVNIYIPLNCLLFTDEDIKTAKQMINEFYEMGVDGLIIQDIGILELDLPPIPIILSTNTGCYTKEDVKFFEKCGVTRIVLPRELSYNEIKDITDNTDIQIETFCYGFLCVGYSGNCYLAYNENLQKEKTIEESHYNASNHGVCPERCMGNWTLKDANGNIIKENDRLLNLRFLNLYNEIEKLVDIGVDSFKIAGREKDLKHVKNSTAMFSKMANILVETKGAKRPSSGRTILGFEPDFSKNFNKGFTDFFFNGRKKEMYSKYHLVGTNVGKVIDFKNNSFKLDSDKKLNIGDKLRYQKDNKEVKNIEIIDIKDNVYFCNQINENLSGLELYRYIDVAGFREVEDSVNYRVISVKLNIKEKDSNYNIIATDEDNNTIEILHNIQTNRINKNEIQKQLFKIDSECEFIIDEVETDTDIFIDDKDEFKNIIFEELRKERAKNRPKLDCFVEKNNYPYYKKELTYLANVTNKCTENFYKRHGVEKIEPGLETTKNIERKRIFNSRYCLRNELGFCAKNKPNNLPPLPWTIEQLETGNRYEIEFDCKKCSMHFYSID